MKNKIKAIVDRISKRLEKQKFEQNESSESDESSESNNQTENLNILDVDA